MVYWIIWFILLILFCLFRSVCFSFSLPLSHSAHSPSWNNFPFFPLISVIQSMPLFTRWCLQCLFSIHTHLNWVAFSSSPLCSLPCIFSHTTVSLAIIFVTVRFNLLLFLSLLRLLSVWLSHAWFCLNKWYNRQVRMDKLCAGWCSFLLVSRLFLFNSHFNGDWSTRHPLHQSCSNINCQHAQEMRKRVKKSEQITSLTYIYAFEMSLGHTLCVSVCH